jgi:hypothetical protein
MGQDKAWRADEVGASRLPGGQSDHPDRGRGQGDPRLDGRPTEDRRALQAEEDEDAAEEALDTRAFAQLRRGPGRRQAIPPLLPLGIPGDDCSGAERRVDLRDQFEPPVTSIEADDPRLDAQEAEGQLQ